MHSYNDKNIQDQHMWRCYTCNFKRNIRKDSIFEGSHLLLGDIIYIIYFWSLELL